MTETIGILGLGNVGGMAGRLLLAEGYEVLAVDRPSTQWFPEAGGGLVAHAKDLAGVTDFVIVALASEGSVEEAYLGRNGLADGGRDGLIVADMGTFAVAQKEQIKAALDPTGAILLDTPISGTPAAMETGRAVIMMSGDEAAGEKVKQMLAHVAPKTSYVGDFGTGIKLKLMINFMVGANTVALAEGMLFGGRMGLDNQTMLDIVGPSAAGSTVLVSRLRRLRRRVSSRPASASATAVHG